MEARIMVFVMVLLRWLKRSFVVVPYLDGFERSKLFKR